MPIGYVRESWWARNRMYLGCLVGVIGALAGVTIVVLGQTDIQAFGTQSGAVDCGTLFAPTTSTACSGTHTPELFETALSAAILVASVVGVVLIARAKPRRPAASGR